MWFSRLFWRRFGLYFAFALLILLGTEQVRRWWQTELSLYSEAFWFEIGFILVACFALSWISTKLVRQPLQQLTEAAAAIARGQYSQRVHFGTPDEYGQLARAFNEMSQAIEREIAQIDDERQELRAVFRCMVEGVIVIDADQQVQFLNEAAGKLLRLPLLASRGRKLWELVRNRHLVQAAEAVLASEVPYRCEVEWNAREPKVLAVQGSNLVGPELRGAVLVLQDITDLRRLERVRQDFVANVSHELKTPLAAIQAGVETLLDGALHDPNHNVRFLERVRENAERLDLLVQDLLTLNRIESGQEQLEIKPVLLRNVVEACLARNEHRVLAKSIRLSTQAPEAAITVHADEVALDHILDNLVDNAIKYTAPGGRITMRWDTDNGLALIQVADTGVGIPEKDLPRIFERFYRVDRARSRELGGTGLGLAIVKHLAQALGGDVQAESKVGVGSTFTVRLPRAETNGSSANLGQLVDSRIG